MNQPVPEELISAYFDGEVTAEERSEVERLLTTSPECRQQLDDTSKLSALLHSFPREAAPAELATNVEKRIASLSPISTNGNRFKFRREWMAFGAGMMATMASLVLFASLFRPNNLTNDMVVQTSDEPVPNEAMYKKTEGMKSVESLSRTSGEKGLDAAIVANPESEKLNEEAPGRSLNRFSRVLTQRERKEAAKSIAAGAAQNGLVVPAAPDSNGSFSLADQSADEAKSQPVNVQNLVNGQLMFDDNSITVTTSSPDEFIAKLPRDGEWFKLDVNAIGVVELLVVDVERGYENLVVALKKHSVSSLDSDESATSPKSFARANQKSRQAKDGEVIVLYVRAPGDQLAGAINDSKNAADGNYVGIQPKLLPLFENENTALVAEQTPAAADKQVENLSDQQQNVDGSVVVEARMAIQNYAERNGLAVEVDADSNSVAAKNLTMAADEKGDSSKKESAVAEKLASSKDAAPQSANRLSMRRAMDQSGGQNSAAGFANINESTPGYKTFYLANDAQQKVGARSAIQQNRSFGVLNSGTQTLPNSPFSYRSEMGNSQRGARSNSNEVRDPGLVRMLIVMKKNQADQSPPPR